MASYRAEDGCLLWAFFVLVIFLQFFVINGEPQVPCYFIFGDSLVDSGNNNDLQTTAKVNYPPYGIDFPGGRPTGRFCNGRTTADIIGELLGFEDFIPPFATADGLEILRGVNYASGSAGILDETGKIRGENIEINKQLRNHQVTISRIENLLGSKEAATSLLKQCLYLINVGSNDYMNNYFVPEYYDSSKQYTPEQFAEVLVQQYSEQITTLYNSGARTVAVNGLGPIGCTPHSIQNYDTNGAMCVDYMNQATILFNNNLKLLVNQLNSKLTDAKLVYLKNVVSPISPRCCKVNEYGQCIPFEKPCPAKILFWDSFHPTEAINLVTAPISFLTLKKSLPMKACSKSAHEGWGFGFGINKIQTF